MKRKAVIIANPGIEGTETYLGGVMRDVDNYERFFTSEIGGYWDGQEITKLVRPSVESVRSIIGRLHAVDYAVIVFSGHGCHDTYRNSTTLELREGEDIDSGELRSGAAKQTLILDCCRKKSPITLMEARDMKFAKAAPRLTGNAYRQYYDKRIAECESGLVVMHAYSIDEAAGDDAQKGGYYSYSLLAESNAWTTTLTIDTSKEYQILSTVRAHDSAVPRVRSISGNRQNPSIEKPRTQPYFPFCIVA